MQPAIALHSVATDPVDELHLANVYSYAAGHGGIELCDGAAAALGLDPHEVADAVEQLVENRLLREAGATSGGNPCFQAVDPQVAAAMLVSPMEREIYRRRELIAQVNERTERYRAAFAATTGALGGPGPVERVSGALEVRGYLKVLSASCHDEILVLQSGKQDADTFNDLLGVCTQLLEQGVTVRIVCQHRSRADLTTRTRLKHVADAGAEIRTLSHIPRSAVVFDRASAVLLGDAGGEPTASCVRSGRDGVDASDDAVLGFLLDLFDHLWEAGAALDTGETGYAEVADDLQRSIVALMAQGFTDEVVARKLGMSVRSCRRHIASLLHDLGAVSRFQAGVQAGRASLVGAS